MNFQIDQGQGRIPGWVWWLGGAAILLLAFTSGEVRGVKRVDRALEEADEEDEEIEEEEEAEEEDEGPEEE